MHTKFHASQSQLSNNYDITASNENLSNPFQTELKMSFYRILYHNKYNTSPFTPLNRETVSHLE